jgi:hypothetical protein
MVNVVHFHSRLLQILLDLVKPVLTDRDEVSWLIKEA